VVDITPSSGTALTGYVLREGNSVGVHDPLYARALVLDDGVCRAAVIVCDTLALDRCFVTSARASIQEATGIPGQNVMIASTHTHSGPATIFLRDCGEVDEVWLATLRQRLVEVSQRALSRLQGARVGYGSGRVDMDVQGQTAPGSPVELDPGVPRRENDRAHRLAALRRRFDEVSQAVNSRLRESRLGSRGREIVVAQNRVVGGGPIDPELGVLRIEDERGKTIAVLVNYACHPTCLGYRNHLISADYPGYVVKAIQRKTGAMAMFITGAGGDVGPSAEGSFARAEALGSALATRALRTLDGIAVDGRANLAVAGETLELPFQDPPSTEGMQQFIAENRRLLSEAQRASRPLAAKVHRAMLGWAEAVLSMLSDGQVPRSVPAEVQVMCLGDIALVGVPGELFVDLGLAIKRGSGAAQVFICGYANDDIGYIPARQAYSEGGYETDEAFMYYGYPAALDPQAGEQLLETAVRLIENCMT
jgi:neutral ceramidase